MRLAPVALFVYNRPETFLKNLKSLKANKLIEKTDVYIFSDGAKNNSTDKYKIKIVRNIIKNIKGLNIKKAICHKKNKGLKKNIIDGINFVFKNNSKIIVIEDDIFLSPYFLSYMNKSLDFIEKKKNIWHVSGWNYPIKIKKKDMNDTFLWQNMNCWGWGTHKKYWKKLNLNSKFFIDNFTKKDIINFNLNGNLNNWSQLKRNNEKKIDTWAIYWNATIFWNNALCLNPSKSYTINIGFEKNSTHTKKKLHQLKKINHDSKINFPISKKKNEIYKKKIQLYLSKSKKISFARILSGKIYNFLR